MSSLLDLVEMLKKSVGQGVSNFKGNVQAIANPQTRNQWMSGVASPVLNSKPLQNLQTNWGMLSGQIGSPNSQRAFQVGMQQKDVGQPKALQPFRQFVSNYAIPFASGVQDMRQGDAKFKQPGAFNKLQGASQVIRGMGKAVLPINPVYQISNALSSGTPMTQNNLLGRVTSGIMQGQSGVGTVGANVKSQNTRLPVIGDVDIAKSIGGMYGFTKNPVNEKFFQMTNKLLPSEKLPIKQFIAVTGARGFLENVALKLSDIPDNATDDQKLLFLMKEGGYGSLSEIGTHLGLKIGGKTLSKLDDELKVKKAAAELFNTLKKWNEETDLVDVTKKTFDGVVTNSVRMTKLQKLAYNLSPKNRGGFANLTEEIGTQKPSTPQGGVPLTKQQLNEEIFQTAYKEQQINDPINNELYDEMRKAQEKLMATIDKEVKGKYEKDSDMPKALLEKLNNLKNDWNNKATQWQEAYPIKKKISLTPEQIKANEKLPDILFAKTKAEAEGIKKSALKGSGPQPLPPQKPGTVEQGFPRSTQVDTTNQTRGAKTAEQVLKQEQPRYPQPNRQTGEIPTNRQTGQPSGSGTSFEDSINKSDINVKSKVAIWDLVRTPDRVLKKIGLEKESNMIRDAHAKYVKELPIEINKVTEWSKQVSPDANQRIFQHLDGGRTLTNPDEIRVAGEIKQYLAEWADKLSLPKEKRISNYITHIFEKGMIEKEFDPDVAKLITDKVAGSVYDPFTQQRLGKMGYVEDTWRALDAYVKRATRKYNMDPALKATKQAAEGLEQSQYKYVKSYIDRINMRPTDLDNLLDNTIKSVVGYKLGQRPTTSITQGLRQMVYRGTLGLNPGSALKNLTQGANTYARLGEKYTLKGYMDLAKSMVTKSDELERVGVLSGDIIEDRTINATKKFWEKLDKGLFTFFEMAERINRGSAYFGAKAKGLSQGLNEQQAIDFAKKVVRDTQFTFGSVDTPPVLQGDINKTLLQFQSFNLKQAEFLGEMIKSKDFKGLLRFGAANMVILLTVGKIIGMDWKDIIPFSGVATGDTKLGQTPPVKLGMDLVKTAIGAKGEYGEDPTAQDRINTIGNDLIPFIPAGVQMKKTIEGLIDTSKGYAPTGNTTSRITNPLFGKTDKVKFVISKDPVTKIRASVFGTNNLPEAKQYYDSKAKPLSEKQSTTVKGATDMLSEYKKIIEKRTEDRNIDSAKEQMKAGTTNTATVGQKILIKQPNGDIKTIDMSFQPTAPKLTGNTELDKKLISKYNSQITSKVNDIIALYEANKISDTEAEKQLQALVKMKTSYAKAKKPRKITIKKVKMPSFKMAKLKQSKVKKITLPKMPKIKIAKYKEPKIKLKIA